MNPRGPGAVLEFWIQPGASRTRVVGWHGSPPQIKVQVAAPPSDGEANEALLGFLKKLMRPVRVKLVHGFASRCKRIEFEGATSEQVIQKLGLQPTPSP